MENETQISKTFRKRVIKDFCLTVSIVIANIAALFALLYLVVCYPAALLDKIDKFGGVYALLLMYLAAFVFVVHFVIRDSKKQ